MTAKLPEADIAELLHLQGTDPDRAQARLAQCSPEEQAALVCRAPVARRLEILELLPKPEDIIPRLPEAELCFTAKAIGLADAGWLLAYASDRQITAAIDLDAWKGIELDLVQFDQWVEALARAGDASLIRASKIIDPELMFLYLRDRIEVELKPNDSDSNDDWQPAEGAKTLEGQFYYRARNENDDLATITRLLTLLFEGDYWLYFRLTQAVIHEWQSENEEFALRWRNGRLQDLGFPPYEEALAIYAYLPEATRTEVPTEEGNPLDVSAWRLPVFAPQLPVDDERAPSAIFRAAAKLTPDERSAFFYAFLALANKIAIADQLPLGDEETLPTCITKAAELASIGLEKLRAANALSEETVLRRIALGHLFRVGANEERDRNR